MIFECLSITGAGEGREANKEWLVKYYIAERQARPARVFLPSRSLSWAVLSSRFQGTPRHASFLPLFPPTCHLAHNRTASIAHSRASPPQASVHDYMILA